MLVAPTPSTAHISAATTFAWQPTCASPTDTLHEYSHLLLVRHEPGNLRQHHRHPGGWGDCWRNASPPTLVCNATPVAGLRYDGLQITNQHDSRIECANPANPEVIIGIFENAHAHSSNINISGNTFTNQNAGNSPATNLQRGFRVTSHSSATTTVIYQNNTVTGANIELPMARTAELRREPAGEVDEATQSQAMVRGRSGAKPGTGKPEASTASWAMARGTQQRGWHGDGGEITGGDATPDLATWRVI